MIVACVDAIWGNYKYLAGGLDLAGVHSNDKADSLESWAPFSGILKMGTVEVM